MTQRIPVKCNTCNIGVLFRMGLGAQDKQTIAVQCPNCKEKIGISLIVNKDKRGQLESLELDRLINCVESSEDESFIAMNVHPELVYPKEYLHEKFFLMESKVSMILSMHAKEKGLFNEEKARQGFMISNFHGLGGDGYLLKDWEVIKTCWSLINSDRTDIYEKKIINYSNYTSLHKNSRTFNDILFDFFYRFINPNTKLYNLLEDEFEKARKLNNDEFLKLKEHFINDLKEVNWRNYLKIFDEYFKNFDDFNRILLNTKIEFHPDEGSECIICPVNFNSVDMFYGNAFENITNHIETLVLCNNILNNRNFDSFERLDSVNKYRDLNKDSKTKPLQNNGTFSKFTEHFDSTIRNASHHRWFYVDDKNPHQLMYRSGGTGALRHITYIDYIYKCNQMALSLAAILMIEIYLLDQ